MADCKTCNFENICEMPEFVRNNLKDCKVYEVKKKQTNADRIRAMSDEELAKWLTKITDDAQLDARTKCNYQWADWLQSEAEEPHD